MVGRGGFRWTTTSLTIDGINFQYAIHFLGSETVGRLVCYLYSAQASPDNIKRHKITATVPSELPGTRVTLRFVWRTGAAAS